jgi:hypothetical protein
LSTRWRPPSTCAFPAPHPAGAHAPAPEQGLLAATLALLPDFWTATPPVARQAGPDLAVHHHAVLGRVGQSALHRAGLGRRALGYGTTQASALVGVVAIGTAAGAVLASMRMRLDTPRG